MNGPLGHRVATILLGLASPACLAGNPGWDVPGEGTSEASSSSTTDDGTSTTGDVTSATTDDPKTTGEATSTSTSTTTGETGEVEDTESGLDPDEIAITFGERGDADVQGGAQDTFVDDFDPTWNFGTHLDVHVGVNGEVALFSWDLSALPPGADIRDAWVELSMVTEFTGQVAAYQVLEPWSEGDQDEGVGAPNWTQRTSTELWTTAGVGVGSRANVAAGEMEAKPEDQRQVLDLESDMIEGWLEDPSTNHGIVLVAWDADYGELASKEHENVDLRPLLTVIYRLD